jgi:hypothetical protein
MQKLTRTAFALAAAGLVATLAVPIVARAADSDVASATPRAQCGPGSVPETGMQGRVVAADANGVRCNMAPVGHFGNSGGFRVHRYVDAARHECAYYDSTPMFPLTAWKQGAELTGVYVLDMSDPTNPVKTDNLLTPAMQSPHESLSINTKRGLLAANMGNAFTYPGVVDIYDISGDCRHPVLKSSTLSGILGHEGAFSPDGNTLWVTSGGAGTMAALDVTDPANPVRIWSSVNEYRVHGENLSDDGNRFYGAVLASGKNDGLTIFDVSEVQARKPDPQVKVVSQTRWANISIPQTAIPVTIGGHAYAVEIDEFASDDSSPLPSSADDARVGAARIIDIADETKPVVVSDIRLEVNQPGNRAKVMGDPGTTNPIAGYAGHYCAVPQRTDPGIVACSFILSGLRVFDIRDPLHPKEIAYFNPPGDFGSSPEKTSFAMSAPAFAPERGEIWYADGNTGVYALRVTNGVWPFATTAASASAPQPAVLAQTASRPAPADTGADRLPVTGGSTLWAVAGVAVLMAAVGARRLARI